MKRPKRLLLLVLVIVVAAAALAAWRWRSDKSPGAVDRLTLYGNVDIREVQLAFEVSGRVKTLDVREGAHVKAGQVVASLDTARFQDAVNYAKARVTVAEEKLAKLIAGTRPEDIDRARADVSAAQAESRNAAARFRRVQHLEKAKLASPQDLDDARSNADAARARLRAARLALALAVAGPRKEDIAAAKGEFHATEAQLATAQRNLSDATLRAPAQGVIRNRILEPGDMAAPSQPVYTLALTSPLWVRAYLPEKDLGRVRLGMAARVTTDSYPGRSYRGWIGYISPSAEFTPKSVETPDVRTDLVYQIRIYVCEPEGQLRLGMPATVHLRLGENASESASPGCENTQ